MSDQPISNQPTLSPEEELDILEAVYKIGKEKGLDLLRPEQVRKLTEAGRMKEVFVYEDNEEVFMDKNEAVKITYMIVRDIKRKIASIVGETLTDGTGMIEKKFVSLFGSSSKDFGYTLFKSFVGVE